MGLPSKAHPIIGEWATPSDCSSKAPAVVSNKLSPSTYLNLCGLDKCAYSPPYWLLYPSKTLPLALSNVVVSWRL